MSFEPTQVLPDEQDVASVSSLSSSGDSNEEGGFTPTPLRRSFAVAGKRPMAAAFGVESSEADEQPDLGAYFASFGLAHASQIAMCRTYANYLAAMTRPKKYKSRKV